MWATLFFISQYSVGVDGCPCPLAFQSLTPTQPRHFSGNRCFPLHSEESTRPVGASVQVERAGPSSQVAWLLVLVPGYKDQTRELAARR